MQAVVAETTSNPVALIAHDMGTSVATELLARDLDGHLPFELQAGVLSNGKRDPGPRQPATDPERVAWAAGPVVARLANRGMFSRGFARLFSPHHPLSAEEAEAQLDATVPQRGSPHRAPADLLPRRAGCRRATLACAVRDWPKRLALLWALDEPVATTCARRGPLSN